MRLFIVPFALFATLTSCKIRSFNVESASRESAPATAGSQGESHPRVPREVDELHKMPSCEHFGVEFIPTEAFSTPDGYAGKWVPSNSLISTFIEANGQFPQVNFAIRLYMMDHYMRDPYLDLGRMAKTHVTEPQWKKVAQVMTNLHRANGVKLSSASFYEKGTQRVPDKRIQGVIDFNIKGVLDLIGLNAKEYFQHPARGFEKDLSMVTEEFRRADSPYQGLRCSYLSTVQKMRKAIHDARVVKLNEEWKIKITAKEGIFEVLFNSFDRLGYFNKTIRPTFENVVRPELANDEERRAFEVI
jgi:hypothetical protein